MTLREGTALRLQSPTLSAVEFDRVVEPFLDRDLLYPRETDYLMTCSVFAPLQDALGRANLEPGDVDFCLLVGGSALIPQIVEAVDDFFSEARTLCFERLGAYADRRSSRSRMAGVLVGRSRGRDSFGRSPATASAFRPRQDPLS